MHQLRYLTSCFACSEQYEDSSNLKLLIGASMIPHPEKMDRGGEDAYFMTEDGKFLGEDSSTHQQV